MNRWHLFTIFILIGGSSWLWFSRVPLDAQQNVFQAEPALNHPAPDFTLTTLAGESFTLRERLETPIVLNFWATWCGPCQRELPALQATAEQYAGQVQIIGVDQAEPPERVQEYVDQLGLSFEIPMDTDHAVADRYQVRGLPTTFFIDREGVIRYIWSGEMNRITLAEGIAEIWP